MAESWQSVRGRLSIFQKGETAPNIREDRALLGQIAVPLPAGLLSQRDFLGGRPAEWLIPARCDRRFAVLYFHGGGYAEGNLAYSRVMGTLIAQNGRIPTVLLDYRLAPENPFPAAIDDAAGAYEALLRRGFLPEHIAFAGESSGGGLAAAAARAVLDKGLPSPAAVYAASPWLDLTLSHSRGSRNTQSDALLSPPMIDRLAGLYAGTTGREHPWVSPLFAELSGFPPVLIHAGGREILLEEAEAFAGRAREQGGRVTLRVSPRGQHVYVLLGEATAASRQAVDEMAEFLQNTLRVPL